MILFVVLLIFWGASIVAMGWTLTRWCPPKAKRRRDDGEAKR